MDIAIIGANGDVGRSLAAQIVARQLISQKQRLQLVGRRGGSSERALYGLRADLYDAFAEITPEIDVALSPQDVAADLILFTAGSTASTDSRKLISRAELGENNLPVFEEYAQALAERGHGEEVVVVITNPVELGVEIFSRYLGPQRVLGMGAYQDTMRLRREIASDLGVRRQRVDAWMLGEHGDALVPVLSNLWIYGFNEAEVAHARRGILNGRSAADFAQMLGNEKQHLRSLLVDARVEEAFRYAEGLPPDLRSVLLPLITHISGAKTAISTAATTVELAEDIVSGRQVVIPAQVKVSEHQWDGPAGVLGLPVVFGLRGWSRVMRLELDPEESASLRASARTIASHLKGWLG